MASDPTGGGPEPSPGIPPGIEAGARRCLRAWATAAGLLAACTLLAGAGPGTLGVWLRPLDLGTEANAAAWFSACSLLWSGLLMASAAGALRRVEPAAAAATLFLGLVAGALFVDEAGSLHERFDLLVPAAWGLSLNGVGAAGAVPVAAALAVLFGRRRALGPAWALLLGAYLLFGAVFAQELLEHAVDWPTWLLPLRLLVEEGTELCGFFLLLTAAVRLRVAASAASGGAGGAGGAAGGWGPVLPDRGVLVGASLVGAALGPPLIALSLSIPFPELSLANRGNFGSTMQVAVFLAAGGLCLRRAAGGGGRAWVGLAAGCVGLSLLQNWHAYADATRLLTGRPTAYPWRACFDVVWALPVFACVAWRRGRRGGPPVWLFAALVPVWLACVAAAARGGFLLSYASSWAAAVAVAAWVVAATRAAAPVAAGGSASGGQPPAAGGLERVAA